MPAAARKFSFEERLGPQTKPKHILILGGLAESLTNFRGPLIKAMLVAGHRVTAAAGDDDPDVARTLRSWGAAFEPVALARVGMNPLADLATLRRLVRLMRRTAPDIFFGYAIKPVTYGLVAARITNVPKRYAMITGLGYAFTEGRELRRRAARLAAMAAYSGSLQFAHRVIFQNPDDEAFFCESGLLRDKAQAGRVNGSGVDLVHFAPAPLPEGPITFLMIARLLRDKGVYEYVEAARIVKRHHPQARFVLVGPFDPNPAAIRISEIESWVNQGIVDYKGAVKDVRPTIAACHVYVLPSYREGMPRTVLEAMAMGRAVITTNVPGCRETVLPNETGLLIPPRDVGSLVTACTSFARDRLKIVAMSSKAAGAAKSKFDAEVSARTIVSLMQI